MISSNDQTDDFLRNIHNAHSRVSDWRTALGYLLDGNKRFCSDQTIPRGFTNGDAEILKDGQNPFAAIVTCSDSRVAPEIYFDQKHGDIFVIRNTGNIADVIALGSIEYAAEHLKTPLVVVVGHSQCGAVAAAVGGGVFSENLQAVINTISAHIKDITDIDRAVRANIDCVVETIKDNAVVRDNKTVVIGAFYEIETGEVLFKNI